MLEFNPVNPLAAKTPWLINNRDHRKLLVVDGRTAFIGGINISSVYSSGSVARRTAKCGREHCRMARYRPSDRRPRGRRTAEAVHGNLGKAARQAACRERIFSRAEAAGQRNRARHRQHARRSLQPDLPDADIGDRQCGKAGVSDQRVLRSRPPAAEVTDRCRRARRRCEADTAEPFRLRNRISRRALALFRRCSKAVSRSTSGAARCCIPRRRSSTASGPPWARPTWIGAASSTTTRSTR